MNKTIIAQNTSNIQLTLRQRVILSSVWSLTEAEKLYLDSYHKNYVNAGYLKTWIDTNHPYKDRLHSLGKDWDIHYVNTCFSDIETLNKADILLLSFRSNERNKFYSVLILKNPKASQMMDENPRYIYPPNGNGK